jgi:hypothetical protein
MLEQLFGVPKRGGVRRGERPIIEVAGGPAGPTTPEQRGMATGREDSIKVCEKTADRAGAVCPSARLAAERTARRRAGCGAAVAVGLRRPIEECW